jgi:hypothetical protein
VCRLTGTIDYNPRFPPRDAKKGYVARITGRASGAVKYQREFLGSEVTILPGDEGLYERQRGDRKGGYTRWLVVIVQHAEHGLIIDSNCDEVEFAKLAKLLDEGVLLVDAVEITNLRPSEKVAGRMVFDAVARTKSQAKQAAVGQTIDSAVEACWAAMCNLPEKEAKKVLSALKLRVSPAKPSAAPAESPPQSDEPRPDGHAEGQS